MPVQLSFELLATEKLIANVPSHGPEFLTMNFSMWIQSRLLVKYTKRLLKKYRFLLSYFEICQANKNGLGLQLFTVDEVIVIIKKKGLVIKYYKPTN